MQVRTEPLTDALFEREIGHVYELCLEFDPEQLDVAYGWACNLDMDDLWKNNRIRTNDLAAFVNRSTSEGIVELGGSDLHIKGVNSSFAFTLCHEADIHFESPKPSLVARVTGAWGQRGVRFYDVEAESN